MKTLILCAVLCSSLHAMALEKTREQWAKEQASIEVAGKLKTLDGPEADWHEANSFIQAIINPINTTFTENGITFGHYKREYIEYEATYEIVKERLDLLCGADCESVENDAREALHPMDPFKRLSELEKYRIARAWFYEFLSDDYFNTDLAKEAVRKKYLAALMKTDHTELARLSSVLACQSGSLRGHIKHKIHLLLSGVR